MNGYENSDPDEDDDDDDDVDDCGDKMTYCERRGFNLQFLVLSLQLHLSLENRPSYNQN